MDLPTVTAVFGWCTVINAGLLILTTVSMYVARERIVAIHSRMFGIEPESVRLAYFQYLAMFKIATLIFSVVPYLALKAVAG